MKKELLCPLSILFVAASLALAEPATASAQEGAVGPPAVAQAANSACQDWFAETDSATGRFWARAEYLLWWIKDDQVPPLVTTGPAVLPPPPIGGLATPGTAVLFGGDIDKGEFHGGRFTAGFWLDPCQQCGVEFSYFFLAQNSEDASFNSDQFPVLARPFQSANTGIETSEFLAFPGLITGGIRISSPSRLWGGDANFRKNCLNSCTCRLDLLAGFRYLDLDEALHIEEAGIIAPAAGLPVAGPFAVSDDFSTRNQFYGGQVGIEAELRRGRWFALLRGKVALGVNDQEVRISGSTTATPVGGAPVTVPFGLLALSTNSGDFQRERFAVVPEVGVDLGFQVTPRLRTSVGYTFLYWSNVVRPGDQIDRVLDETLIPFFGSAAAPVGGRPAVLFNASDFWAQGINFSVEYRW